jgi:hypothetical protein
MRWAGNIARLERKGRRRRRMHVGYWWDSQKKRDY